MQQSFSPTRGLLEFILDNLSGPNPHVHPQARQRRRRTRLIQAKIGRHTAPLQGEALYPTRILPRPQSVLFDT